MIVVEACLAVVATFAISFLLTFVARRMALSRGMMDVPNERSSHAAPTPRGGGVAIVVASLAASCVLFATHALSVQDFAALLGGGLPVAIIGLLDDRRPVSASVRLAVHLASAVWAVYILGGLPPIRFGAVVVHLAVWGDVLAVFAIIWMLNLFNFMDGIDGIAASEAIFVAAAGAILCGSTGPDSSALFSGLTVAAASLGFLVWNWPPAKIFMGDVGSGYLGYVIGVLALTSAQENPDALWVWLILGGVFFVDATLTLLRRTLRGDRVYVAHRSHAYQWLSRRWKSHKSVTVGITAVNVLWLLPCAWFAVRNPVLAGWTTLVALAPVTLVAVSAGAGRRESL